MASGNTTDRVVTPRARTKVYNEDSETPYNKANSNIQNTIIILQVKLPKELLLNIKLVKSISDKFGKIQLFFFSSNSRNSEREERSIVAI